MYNCGMRQIEEKHVANQVKLMVWSHKLDLLALCNFKGEVQVHRLNWQKVWNLPPPMDNYIVEAMAWRPDGKALAIGYNSGCVCLVDIEDKEILHKFYLKDNNISEVDSSDGITCFVWSVRSGNIDNLSKYNIYEDASIFLLKPPALNSSYKNQSNDENLRDIKEQQEQSQLNILVVGYGGGFIHMSIFGRFPICQLHLSQLVNDEYGDYNILNVNLADDFSSMQVLYYDKLSDNIYVAVINTTVLSAFSEEVFMVANRHGQIVQLVSRLDHTMISITEAWEHILLEMDGKMADYAASVPDGGVSADFLELLMMGVPSDELELFLLQELTAKGLKKFGSSVELSYSTIQKLVLKQLNIVGQSLTYHLAELRGLTRIPDRYKILGLEETIITDAIKSCCAFLNKCLELQQVIDFSMRNYKAFFRWLFVVIVRLLDEQTPSEIVKITQQELTHIADFLYNFDNIQVENPEGGTEKTVKFNLERLAQYLQDQELTILPDGEDNPWYKFLKNNPCLLKDNDTIFDMSPFRKYSLVQQQNYLKDAINKVFDLEGKDIGMYFSILYNIKCYEDRVIAKPIDNLRVSQMYDPSQRRFMMAVMYTPNCNEFCFMTLNLNSKDYTANVMKYGMSAEYCQDQEEYRSAETIQIMDLQFYSTDFLSLLLKHPSKEDSTLFLQLPTKIALDNTVQYNIKSRACAFHNSLDNINMGPLLEPGIIKELDKMDGVRLAVSGGRKVSVVLSKSLRKVRVFEMEVSEEDEETIDSSQSHNATQKSDVITESPKLDA